MCSYYLVSYLQGIKQADPFLLVCRKVLQYDDSKLMRSSCRATIGVLKPPMNRNKEESIGNDIIASVPSKLGEFFCLQEIMNK